MNFNPQLLLFLILDNQVETSFNEFRYSRTPYKRLVPF